MLKPKMGTITLLVLTPIYGWKTDMNVSLHSTSLYETPYPTTFVEATSPLSGIEFLDRTKEPAFSENLVEVNSKKTLQLGLSLSKKDLAMHLDEILLDPLNRVSDTFQIAPNMHPRVAFWFDIYTKYDSTVSVVHDVDRPWIIYNVVDSKPIEARSELNRWTRYHMAKKQIRTAIRDARNLLTKLSQKKSFRDLTADEQQVYSYFEKDKNPRASMRRAIYNMRAQTGQKNFIEQGLGNASIFFPQMESVFRQNKLPEELTRLPLVESSFNLEANSKAGARGIWQIMPGIGRKFLIINDELDERLSPIKATRVAALLFKEKYHSLKSWPLAVTAYNHGPKGVKEGTRVAHSQDLVDVINRYHAKAFGFASKNFYACFLAVLYAEKYQEYFFDSVVNQQSLLLTQTTLKGKTKIKDLLLNTGLDFQTLKDLNPELKEANWKENKALPKNFRLLIPVDRKAQILSSKEDMIKFTTPGFAKSI